MRLYLDCLTGLGKFQGNPCHVKVDPSVPSKKTPYRPVPICQQAAFKQQLSEMQAADIIKPMVHAIL